MKKLFLLTVSALALTACVADYPNSTHSANNAHGYYDSRGVWHDDPYWADHMHGYYDAQGYWHEAPVVHTDGYYDDHGVWHETTNDDRYYEDHHTQGMGWNTDDHDTPSPEERH